MWENLKYQITGIAVVDNIFTLLVKIICMVFLIIMAVRCIKNYNDGQTGQMIISGISGLLLLAMIIGFSNIANAAKGISEAFNFGGGSGSSTGGGSAK
ncbi:hypothetical protein ACFSR7_06225 [Cohnella sp. GCM10020058]|uniref:hypothetical protein n=1 Tax=Cohnella sp. GCM10020058 TaxID=3317330 RepID=UPI0036443152